MPDTTTTTPAVNADNITNATGYCYYAPAGTALPTSASADLASTYTCAGHVDSEGVTITNNHEVLQIDAWDDDDVLELDMSDKDEIKFALIEYLAPAAQKLMHGTAAVTTATGGALQSVAGNSPNSDEVVAVFDMHLRNSKLLRMVVPRFKVTGIGDTTYKKSDIVKPEITASALKPATGERVIRYFG